MRAFVKLALPTIRSCEKWIKLMILYASRCLLSECITNAKKTLNVKSGSHAGVNGVACFVIFTVQLSKKFWRKARERWNRNNAEGKLRMNPRKHIRIHGAHGVHERGSIKRKNEEKYLAYNCRITNYCEPSCLPFQLFHSALLRWFSGRSSKGWKTETASNDSGCC